MPKVAKENSWSSPPKTMSTPRDKETGKYNYREIGHDDYELLAITGIIGDRENIFGPSTLAVEENEERVRKGRKDQANCKASTFCNAIRNAYNRINNNRSAWKEYRRDKYGNKMLERRRSAAAYWRVFVYASTHVWCGVDVITFPPLTRPDRQLIYFPTSLFLKNYLKSPGLAFDTTDEEAMPEMTESDEEGYSAMSLFPRILADIAVED